MSMTWLELKNEYIRDHYSKMLEQPGRRIIALEIIEGISNEYYREIIENPSVLKKYDKNVFTEMIRVKKTSGKISGADKSVIIGLYKFLQ